jgi:hypothetical protein
MMCKARRRSVHWAKEGRLSPYPFCVHGRGVPQKVWQVDEYILLYSIYCVLLLTVCVLLLRQQSMEGDWGEGGGCGCAQVLRRANEWVMPAPVSRGVLQKVAGGGYWRW